MNLYATVEDRVPGEWAEHAGTETFTLAHVMLVHVAWVDEVAE
jgi:hypothetical protein